MVPAQFMLRAVAMRPNAAAQFPGFRDQLFARHEMEIGIHCLPSLRHAGSSSRSTTPLENLFSLTDFSLRGAGNAGKSGDPLPSATG